jgi:prolyl-tRNA synthetase
MLLEKLCAKRHKEDPKGAELPGHKLMLKGGFIHQTGQGLYTLSYLGVKMRQKIEAIVRKHLNPIMQEVNMPLITPAKLWEESGRIDKIDVLAKFESKSGVDFVIAPTHEEIIVDYAKSQIESYKDLPTTLYQIQTKYRDEKRARGGLVRTRELMMKDAYSFNKSKEDLNTYYFKVLETYHKIYKELGFNNVIDIESDTGDMGGYLAHEFMLINENGADTIYICKDCGYKANKEIYELNKYDENKCPKCQSENLEKTRGIEVGNIFQLGDKYTTSLNMTYTNESGEKSNPYMGCYGIGISRCLGSLFEQSYDDCGPILPITTAPFEVHITTLSANNKKIKSQAEQIYERLEKAGIDTILDTRDDIRPGEMFADADLIAAPIRLIISPKNIEKGIIEIKYRTTQTVDNLPHEIKINKTNKVAEIIKTLKAEYTY